MRRAFRMMRTQRGASAVEFAIMLPVLLLILLGTIDWGYYFFVREIVVNAAREGARAGTLVAPGADATPNARATATAYLTRVGLDTARATVAAEPGTESIIVSVQYEVGSITGFLSGVLPASATGVAEMRR